jgi:HAD superfamily 5'-nucleotidase-like hydrolase
VTQAFPQQLSLPIVELAAPHSPGIPRPRRIFCNRNLRMSGVGWVGFDMDYTLAIYDQLAMDQLSIKATIDKLVARGYPPHIADIPHATHFPVRGLLIDKRYGHILKMDRYKTVGKGYHGFRKLTQDELRALYHSKKIRPATPRYHWIDTLYALSEASVYAAVVDALEQAHAAIDYAAVFQDIRESIDEAHRDGTILNAVTGDLPRFIKRDPDLAPTLHKLRSAGKKLFLLTNSRWTYTDAMMNYLIGDAMTEYPTWRNYFDVVIAAATKPAFFQERRPLMERIGIPPAAAASQFAGHPPDEVRPATFPLERGKVYEGGNLHDLERALGVTGDQVLYVGDHIYGDILRSKKESAWRTAMVIQELETEVLAHESCRADLTHSEELEDLHERLEDDLRYYQQRFKDLTRQLEHAKTKPNGVPLAEVDAERGRTKRAVERLRGRLKEVSAEIAEIEAKSDACFHPFWGSLLKEGNEQSSFGAQVEEYACLYTSRVSNLLAYSPQQTFRSPRDLMAHEIGG